MIKNRNDAIEFVKATAEEVIERELTDAEIEAIEAKVDEIWDNVPHFEIEIDGEAAAVFER